MKQVEKMQELCIRFDRDSERCTLEFANADKRGEVRRKSSVTGMYTENHAERLFQDGGRRGRITE